MKLIDVETLELVEFPTRPPAPYAILSHTWCTNNADEVQYDDIRTQGINGCPDKPGKFKVEGCCRQAKADGHNYVWIDSCCINKDSAVELGMAINSMYRWYREAAVCYVYMADVPADEGVLDEGGAFSQSRWFKRGWTLQEMLAPPDLHFFNQDWHAIAKKEDIVNDLETITSIPRQYLFDFDPATTTASAAQRMSWAAHRITTREEDCAYCLLGLFDVNLVMIYGEGGRKAFIRLQQAIMEKTGDNSVLAWGSRGQMTSAATNMVPVTMPQAVSVPGGDNSKKSEGIWASEPRDFAHCGNIVTRPVSFAGGCTFASGRMRVDMDLCVAKTDTVPSPSPSAEGVSTGSPRPASSPPFQLRGNTVVYGLLNCGTGRSPDQLTVAIPLALVSSSGGSRDSFVVEYIRPKGFSPILVARDAAVDPGNSHPGIHIRMERDAQGDSQGGRQKLWVGFHYPRQHLALAETYPKAAWRGSTMLMTPTDEIADFGQHNANCCLMLVSQNTQLADLADFVRDMPPLIYKEHVVEVGGR
ncbi:hypothetical protein SCUCBS95973_004461 [Sporothrix curviconia]|uniref:Heterokaryon incompatibility domain-containing protein n=1 Tax=Sporothrix curviconia TaxID=1260050 RepID=A0ABP0BQ74_9PEZI